MKTNLLQVPGGRISSLIQVAAAVISMIPATAVGDFNATDPLSTDSGNWSRSKPNSTSMVFQNSRLEVLIKSPTKNNFSFLTWAPDSGGYQENWFIQADVHLDMMSLPSGSGIVLGVGAMNLNDPLDMAYVGFARERSDGYNLGMFLVTECSQAKPHHYVIATAEDATVRFHFDKSAKTLTGSWNAGSGWRYAPPLKIKDWGMDHVDEFSAFLVAGNFGVNSKSMKVVSGEAYFTNFVAGAVKPDITVEQPGGSNLTDGKTTRPYGAVSIRGPGRAKTFTIHNDGTAALRNLKVTKDGSHAGDFTLTQPAGMHLKPGDSTTFKVTFKPKTTGMRSAAIHVTSNDPDESPFDISLTGTGVK